MTKKHFIRLARIVGTIENDTTRKRITFQIASLCREDNTAFDPQRFKDAVEEAATNAR